MSGTRKITIDWELVDRLLEAGNDGIRVASNIGMHPKSFYRRCEQEHGISFADYLANKRKRGESKILAKQYEKAMKGDNAMLIWVGKQMCGQREPKFEEKETTHNNTYYLNYDPNSPLPVLPPTVSTPDTESSASGD